MVKVHNIENLVRNRAYSFSTRTNDGGLYEQHGYFDCIERRKMRMLVVFTSQKNGRGNVVFVGRFRELVTVAERDAGGRASYWNGEGVDCPAGQLMPDAAPDAGKGQGTTREGREGSTGGYIGDAPPDGFGSDYGGEG